MCLCRCTGGGEASHCSVQCHRGFSITVLNGRGTPSHQVHWILYYVLHCWNNIIQCPFNVKLCSSYPMQVYYARELLRVVKIEQRCKRGSTEVSWERHAVFASNKLGVSSTINCSTICNVLFSFTHSTFVVASSLASKNWVNSITSPMNDEGKQTDFVSNVLSFTDDTACQRRSPRNCLHNSDRILGIIWVKV